MMRVLWLLAASAAWAGDLPSGEIVDRVECSADPSQTYALYVPSNYAPTGSWAVIFAFDPGGRGRTPVDRYQTAAEKYGYLVAGSNNSRNGSWEVSMAAARAMVSDVASRFAIDARRVYTAGMSGGARVAMGVALGSNQIAGAIALSAGYPDSRPRKSVPFAIFGTAGTEDFNYLEMRRLDRELSSPHHLAVFEGGHVWLSSDLAMEAVEWMEIQAMKSGRKPRDEAEIDRILTGRASALSALKSDADRWRALTALVRDFDGLKDVSEFAVRAAALDRDKRLRDAMKKEREEESREQRETDEILAAESRLSSMEQRPAALAQLRDRWKKLAAASNLPSDSVDRRIARRVLRGLAMGAAERVGDPEYRKIVDEHRPPRGPR